MTELEVAAFVEGIAPVVRDGIAQATADLRRRQEATERDLAHLADVVKDASALRERVAVLETRPPVPGPPGQNGADGVGFDDLVVDHDGERAFTVKAIRGEVVKVLGTFTVPVSLYRGVWTETRTYAPGDSVTAAGAEWHCHTATTTKPGDGSKAWTLKVKRAKDGKDGPPGPPGPPGRDWQQVYDDTRRR
jgi:hypothetical protein